MQRTTQQYIDTHGFSPSVRDLVDTIGVSKTAVKAHLRTLVHAVRALGAGEPLELEAPR
jgi:hypothetical protein